MTQPAVAQIGPESADARTGTFSAVLNFLRLERRKLPLLLLLAGVGFLVLYPILSIVLLTFAPAELPDVFGTIAWHQAFYEPGIARSFLNTLLVVGASQSISLPLATLIAWCLGRTDVPGRRIFEFFFWIMFFLPSLGVLTGWLLLFDPDFGLANQWLKDWGWVGESPFNLYSFWGIVFIHVVTHSVAVKVMLLTPAFRNLDVAIEHASQVCGATKLQTLLRVVLPVLTPAILMVLLMSIIRGLETFEIEMVLGAPIKFEVYSNKIYMVMASSPPEFRVAGMLGISIMLLCLPLIILQRWLSTRRSYAVVTGKSSQSPMRLGRWRWPVFALMLLGTTAISLLPLGLLIAGSFMKLFGFFDLPQVWTTDHWSKALTDATFESSFRNMLLLGLATAAIGTFLYSVVAYAVVRVGSRLAAPLDWLSWLPLTVPGIILGFGYVTLALEVPLFSLLYGTLGALILVSVLAAMPLGVQVLKVQMLQMGGDIEEAGRIAGGGWGRTFWHILLPLSAPALAVIAVMVFASTVRAVSTVMLLSSGNNRVLSVLQVEFLSSGNLGPAAVVGTMIVLVSLVAALVVRLISLRFGVHAR